MNTIIIISQEHDVDVVKALIPEYDQRTYFLCPVNYGLERQLKQWIALFEADGLSYHVLDFNRIYNEKAFIYKEKYLRFLYDLSETEFRGKNIKEHLLLPFDQFSAWFLSLVYETNPYKSPAYTKFCKSNTVFDLIQDYKIENVILEQDGGSVQQFIQQLIPASQIIWVTKLIRKHHWKESLLYLIAFECLRICKYFLEAIYRKIYLKFSLKSLKSRWKNLEKSQSLAVTMFPLLDDDALQEGRFVNRAYAQLQPSLEKFSGGNFCWLAMFTKIEGLGWNDGVRFVRKINESGETLFLLEEFLTVKDFMKTIISYFLIFWSTLVNYKQYQNCFIYTLDKNSGKRVNIWRMFRYDFISSFLGKELLVELGYYYAFRNAFKKIADKANVYYFAEMHAWENALNFAVKKNKRLTSIGLQHTIVPLLLMNYFKDSREFDVGNKDTFPKPNFLGCAGQVTRRLFIDNGWPGDQLFISGSFRFSSLMAGRREHERLANREQILVALSISDMENEEVLRLLADTFNDKKISYKILIKPHPCYDIAHSLKKLNIRLDENIFEISFSPLKDTVKLSKAMIVKESSSIFEALSLNIPVIVPNLFSIVDLCPLTKISSFVSYVHSKDELFTLVNRIISQGQIESVAEKLDFINQYLVPFDETLYPSFLRSKVPENSIL